MQDDEMVENQLVHQLIEDDLAIEVLQNSDEDDIDKKMITNQIILVVNE